MNRSDLHFSLFPAGGVEIASSRIRIYEFQSALTNRGIQATFGYSVKANVLFFQKRVTNENIWQARLAKALGQVIIYDVDDLGEALWYYVSKPCFLEMLRIADVITVCSSKQLDFLVSEYNIKNCSVVLNAIDYFPLEPVKLVHKERCKLRIVWFGSGSNIGLLEKYLTTLLQVPNSEVVAIVGKWDIPEFSEKHPAVHFLPWTLCGIVSLLQSCDLACLMHDGKVEDQAKGNNKMIASITWGVPAMMSRTPEYERTALESGIEYALFSDENELLEVIERLRSSEAREQYLQTAQPAIWSRYSPDVIAQQYIDLAQGLLVDKGLRGLSRRIIDKCVF